MTLSFKLPSLHEGSLEITLTVPLYLVFYVGGGDNIYLCKVKVNIFLYF